MSKFNKLEQEGFLGVSGAVKLHYLRDYLVLIQRVEEQYTIDRGRGEHEGL